MITRHTLYGVPWVDLENPTPEEIHTIINEFTIDQDCAVELMRPSLRAKVDRFDDTLFFVLHFPDHPAHANTDGTIEIDFIVNKEFIITSRYEHIDTLMVFEKKHTSAEKSPVPDMHGGILFGLIIDDLYTGLIDELTLVKQDVQSLEDDIFSHRHKNVSQGLIKLHRKFLDCKVALKFHTEILDSFEKEASQLFGKSYEPTMHLMRNNYYRMVTMVDTLREIVLELRETYDATLSNKTNDTIRTLTLMSFMTFPLALLVAIATFPGAPKSWHTEQGFFVLLGIILTIGISMVITFKQKRWF